MKKLSVIGIGAGDPDHLTIQAVKALNRVDVFFLMDKGPAKHTLLDLRREICRRHIVGRTYRFVEADSPERQRDDTDYTASVEDLNRAKQATFERLIDEQLSDSQCGGFLVWGDPALYDSTVRILQAILDAGRCAFEFEVIPGITSLQALAARHKVPLNDIGGSVHITTGRRLAAGQVGDASSVAVMLDGEDAYRQVSDAGTQVYWGAYVGMAEEILIAGRLGDVADDIERTRTAARQTHGWIMDSYLLRKPR